MAVPGSRSAKGLKRLRPDEPPAIHNAHRLGKEHRPSMSILPPPPPAYQRVNGSAPLPNSFRPPLPPGPPPSRSASSTPAPARATNQRPSSQLPTNAAALTLGPSPPTASTVSTVHSLPQKLATQQAASPSPQIASDPGLNLSSASASIAAPVLGPALPPAPTVASATTVQLVSSVPSVLTVPTVPTVPTVHVPSASPAPTLAASASTESSTASTEFEGTSRKLFVGNLELSITEGDVIKVIDRLFDFSNSD